MMMPTFKKLQHLEFGGIFSCEKYRVFTEYAAAIILRHWALMSLHFYAMYAIIPETLIVLNMSRYRCF